MTSDQRGAPTAFKRELRLFDSTMIVVGSMIGSGIFIVSADIGRTVGGGGWLLAVWLITGLITLIAALSYGELAGMMPRAGGQYVYLREAYGPVIGFLYGWTFLLVIQTGIIAAVGVAFAKFLGVLAPALGENNVLARVGGFELTAAQLVAIASIAALTAVNWRGLRTGRAVQNGFTATKTLALIGLIVLGLAIGSNGAAIRANLDSFWSMSWTRVVDGKLSIEALTPALLLAAIGAAMVGSLFSSDAWYNITFTAAEVVEPRRTIPLSMALGTGLVTLLYLLVNISYLAMLTLVGTPGGSDAMSRGIQFATHDRVGVAAAEVIFGAPAAAIMAVLIMISTFGCNNGLILAGARVYYAMARDGLFFRAIGRLNDRGVPGAGLGLQCL
ncbi:MAG: amino acid permease, partial [Deltaproteobacteria bacterium]|nr:amino acid permease [Deltaproteobacteria bacterium]